MIDIGIVVGGLLGGLISGERLLQVLRAAQCKQYDRNVQQERDG